MRVGRPAVMGLGVGIVVALSLTCGPAIAAPHVAQIDAGDRFTCAITADDAPVCWGANNSGQTNVPAGIGTVTHISAGQEHACAVKTTGGTLVCWGNNGAGQVSQTPAGAGFTQVSAGLVHACAIGADGGIACWGSDGSGQVSGTPPASGFTQIAAGDLFNCALSADGSIECWGSNGPGVVSGTPSDAGYTEVSAGSGHACALRPDGRIACWGDNSVGQVSGTPTGPGFAHIALGGDLGCAIKADGTPICWGQNFSGETTVPASIGSVAQTASGGFHSCAIKVTGIAQCWGLNNSGQLGAVPAFFSAALDAVIGASAATLNVSFGARPAAALQVSSGTLPPGLTLNTATGAISGTPTTEGIYSGTFTASNGVFADATQSFTILVDLTSPVTTDNVPATNADAPFEVTLSASDSGGSGLAQTYYTTGVTPATPTTASAVYDPASKPVLTDGERISYFSTDGAGNSEAVKTSAAVASDSVAPTISIVSPTGSYGLLTVLFNPPRAQFSCADNAGGSGLASCTATADGQPIANGAVVPTAFGTHTFRVTATDNADNTNTQTTTYTVNLLGLAII